MTAGVKTTCASKILENYVPPYTATVVQKPFEFGYRSIVLLADLSARGPEAIPAGGTIDTGVVVVTRDNVEAFRAELAQLLQ